MNVLPEKNNYSSSQKIHYKKMELPKNFNLYIKDKKLDLNKTLKYANIQN